MVTHHSRRTVLQTTGAALVSLGLAGCLSGTEDDSSGNGGSGSGSSGDGGNGSTGFDAFDPNDFERTLPQLASTLFDHEFDFGSPDALEQMEPRDEPRYGNAPLERSDDEDDWLDPDVIQFGYGQGEDAETIYIDAMEPLMENMEEETGRDVEFVLLDSAAAQVETMRSDRLHVGSTTAGTTPYMVNIGGGVPFAMIHENGLYGYRLWVATRPDNDEIDSLADLEGKTVAHAHDTSNSGHLAPMALFSNEGIVPGEDYEMEFSGSHENSARGVEMGDYDAAPIASSSYGRSVRAGAFDPDELKVVWASQPFMSNPTSYHHNLHPDLVEGIKRAHFDYDYSGTLIEEEMGSTGFLEFDYATHHDVVLQIHEANGIEYDVGDL
ncbi:phosphate/phosphite/phosphonate ABC transporter substrate-binding protein [Natronobeatus ordinarius]|uniref:phosphate/phosphite/phosphonate ABC transporter substrate-binding protein n=1 Tax=Natronobeatus ordinarius TaxID=2963433 RepID=UPI0020CCFD37|nr:phosphate/phosphite/phosphonate ABC transporter substrate-binding protein [Natronobeatus ordinarius]